MKAQLEVITPAIAAQLLERNVFNRRISERTVLHYADDMRSGRWLNNGQSIVLAENGDLLDGQHRLRAILHAQTPITMLVVTGAPKEAFATIDSGKPRGLPDVLVLEGYFNTYTLAAVARSAYNYAAGVQQGYKPTKAALNAFVTAHPYLNTATQMFAAKRKGAVTPTPMAAVIFLGNESRTLDVEAASFCDGVIYGESLRRGDPRHTLREWVSAERARARGILRTEIVFGAVGRAWNAHASGKELLQIRGAAAPAQRSLDLFGFRAALYGDVPDLIDRKAETSARNLAETKRRKAEAPRVALP